MTHKVCVIECPHCGFEKPIGDRKSRDLLIFQCKKCSEKSPAVENQECFVFHELKENYALR